MCWWLVNGAEVPPVSQARLTFWASCTHSQLPFSWGVARPRTAPAVAPSEPWPTCIQHAAAQLAVSLLCPTVRGAAREAELLSGVPPEWPVLIQVPAAADRNLQS